MCSWIPPTPPHQDKTMKFRQGTKWCCSSFLSNYYLPLSYLRKTKHWSLLHFKGLFSVNLFSRYSLCVLYFLLFCLLPFFSSSSVAHILVLLRARRLQIEEHSVWPVSWFLELRQLIKLEGSLLVSELDFHIAAMSQHPHWHQVQSYVLKLL